jgi:hypothetical protein
MLGAPVRALTVVLAFLAVPALVVLGAGVRAQWATSRPAATRTTPAPAPTAAPRPTAEAYRPVVASDPERQVQAVAVEGRYAYVGVGPRLVVVDVADPARPVEVGRTAPFPAPVVAVTARGARVYVGLAPRIDAVVPSGRGIRIVDASEPARPREVGVFDALRSGAAFAVDDRYLYVADGERGLRVIDAADPARPVDIGRYGELPPQRPGERMPNPRYMADVAAGNGRAYVETTTAGGVGAVQVLDVADPSRITEVARLPIDGPMALEGRTLALLQQPLGDLVLVDVGGPGPPAPVGRHSFLDRVERRPAQARGDLWWMGRYVYTATGYGLDVFDASDPRKPVYLGRADAGLKVDTAGGTAAGHHLFLWWWLDTTVRILDATDPVRPRPVGRIEF